MRYRYTRLYSDESGESHFQDLDLELSATDFAASSPPVFLSSPVTAKSYAFFGAPGGWIGDWHVSSGRNLFVVVSGEWEVEASDGEVRTFNASQTLLVEDITGKGHRSRVLTKEGSLAFLVQLNNE